MKNHNNYSSNNITGTSPNISFNSLVSKRSLINLGQCCATLKFKTSYNVMLSTTGYMKINLDNLKRIIWF